MCLEEMTSSALSLVFLIYKMGIIIPTLWSYQVIRSHICIYIRHLVCHGSSKNKSHSDDDDDNADDWVRGRAEYG